MKKVKILLVTHLFSKKGFSSISGGYYRLAYYLGKYCSVDLLTWGLKDSREKRRNFTIIYKKTPKSDIFLQRRLALSLYAYKIAKNYDLVHALFPVCGFFPVFKYPTVVTEHILKELDPDIWMYYQFLFQKFVDIKSRRVICVSRNLVKILKEKYGVTAVFIPHGIDIHEYFPMRKDEILKNKLLGKKFKHLCIVCGMYAINRRALYNIIKAFKNILFLRISKPEKKIKYPNIIYYSGISEEKKKKFYSIADFIFKPITFSSASNTILEAMAMGKVVITNRIGGTTDYLDDSCGYLASSDADFPKLFRRAMNNKHEVEEKGRNARLKVEREFSWEVITPKIIKIYQQALAYKI